jgi:tRNA threonylcarbamoyladenosine biosynthesis protein TsaB
MNILAVDTSASILSIALGAGDESWYFEADAGLRHSELLLESVDLLLHKAGIPRTDLSGVVCRGGPGSFTGLRIGFSFAKGLSLALGIPFAPLPTLDCMAHPFAAWPGIVAPVIDAKKNAFFCALYQNGKRLCPDMDAAAPSIASAIDAADAEAIAAAIDAADATTNAGASPVLLTGTDAEKLYHQLREEAVCGAAVNSALRFDKCPRGGYARELLDIAKKAGLPHTTSNWFAGPEYLRKSDAELQAPHL